MGETQQLVLFWVFVVFFSAIVVIALLTVVGVIKTEERFHKWAVATLFTGIAGVVFVWAKSPTPAPPVDFFVNLAPPKGVQAESFDLVSGTYEYFEESSSEGGQRAGAVELTAGQLAGWWTAKLAAYKGKTPPSVKLTLKDGKGKAWTVPPFYPNYNNRSLTSSQDSAAMSLPVFALVAEARAAEREIKFDNYAKVTNSAGGRTYHLWRVFVNEPPQVLNEIAEVQYLLHPSFPEPLQVRTGPKDKFAIEASGWGQFLIQITIRYKDGSVSKASYPLDFNKKWP